jgi:flagellar motility protein MotE (MotC chaperone)
MRPMRIDRWKTFWAIAVTSFFGGSVALVFTGDDVAAEADHAPAAAVAPAHGDSVTQSAAASEVVVAKTAEGCLADSATLDDLRRQKLEIEGKQKDIGAREAELKAREQALEERIKSIDTMRDEIARIEQGRKNEAEAKVAKLVETVESMNPKAASTLLAALDEGLATSTMARLSTAKLAKVMNVMDPSRSTRLSELLAGVARAKTRSAAPAAPASTASKGAAEAATGRAPARSGQADGPSKGGDTNDGKSHDQQQSSNRTTADGSSSRR